MAARSPIHHETQPASDRVAAVLSRTREVVAVLPGALLLLAFQLFTAQSGAISRLQPPEQAAFAVSLVSVGLGIVMLVLLIRRRALPRNVKDVDAYVELTSLLVLAGMGALAGGLGSDFFVVGTRLTGSPGEGGLVGTLALALVCVPWL
jgi:hypothetical protein